VDFRVLAAGNEANFVLFRIFEGPIQFQGSEISHHEGDRWIRTSPLRANCCRRKRSADCGAVTQETNNTDV
jgi:hypothetical protein